MSNFVVEFRVIMAYCPAKHFLYASYSVSNVDWCWSSLITSSKAFVLVSSKSNEILYFSNFGTFSVLWLPLNCFTPTVFNAFRSSRRQMLWSLYHNLIERMLSPFLRLFMTYSEPVKLKLECFIWCKSVLLRFFFCFRFKFCRTNDFFKFASLFYSSSSYCSSISAFMSRSLREFSLG